MPIFLENEQVHANQFLGCDKSGMKINEIYRGAYIRKIHGKYYFMSPPENSIDLPFIGNFKRSFKPERVGYREIESGTWIVKRTATYPFKMTDQEFRNQFVPFEPNAPRIYRPFYKSLK